MSAIVLSGHLMSDGNPRHFRSGFFLGYVGVFAAENALLGIFALRARNVGVAGRAALVVGPLLLATGAVPLAILGATRAPPLFIFFAVVGAAQGVAHLRVVLSPPVNPRERTLAHMGAMGASCITTLAAFVVVNAPRLGMRTFDFRLWAVPIVFLGIGLTLWRRLKLADSLRDQ